MITAGRTRHRIAWIALAVLLPLILAVAWRAHRPPPLMERLPAELTSSDHP